MDYKEDKGVIELFATKVSYVFEIVIHRIKIVKTHLNQEAFDLIEINVIKSMKAVMIK